MLSQSNLGNQYEWFQLMIYIAPVIGLVFTFYAIIAFLKYKKNKSTVALHFSLANFFYGLSMFVLFLGILDTLANDYKTNLYFTSVMFMNIAIILNSLFLYLFSFNLIKQPPSRRKNMIIIAIAIILFHFLPQNGWYDTANTGFKLMYVSFMLMTLYAFFVYFILMKEFLYLSRKALERGETKKIKTSFDAIWIGSLLMNIFFILQMIRVGVDVLFLQIAAMTILFIAMACLFIGFLLPSLTKK